MRIGIDASRAAVRQRTGTENYSLHLIRAMLQADEAGRGGNEFILYFNNPPAPGLVPAVPHCELRVMPFRRFWTHARLSWEMVFHAPEVLFVPAHVLPLIHPRHSVVTIHDLGYLYYPGAHDPRELRYLRLSTAYNARWAAHIIAMSKATKRDIVERLGINPAKVTVIYQAPGREFRPMADKRRLTALRRHYGLHGDYILYVGTLHPRKNVARLVQAYARLRKEGRIEARLVLAGKKGWLPQDILDQLQEVRDSITLTGFFPEEELPLLYSAATVFVMPSLFEGFGLPVLEAMACGTPVIAANTSSLTEVVGDAGILVDPLSVEEIAQALERVVKDKELQAHLREKGLARAKEFSWARAAKETLSLLRTVSLS